MAIHHTIRKRIDAAFRKLERQKLNKSGQQGIDDLKVSVKRLIRTIEDFQKLTGKDTPYDIDF